MPISLICPQCSSKLRVGDDMVDRNIKCPKCSTVFPASPEERSAAITAKAPSSATAQGIKSAADSLEDLEQIEELEDADEEQEGTPRVRRRKIRREDEDEDEVMSTVSTFIPYKNGRALAAYYLGVFSLIPCLGLLLGPAALVMGILGLRYVNAHPTAKGTGHAIAGVVLGGLTTLGNWGLFLIAVMGGIAGALGK